MAGRSLFGMAAAPLAGATSDWLGSRWRVAAWALVIGTTGMALMTSGAPAAILAGVALCAVTRGSMPTIATSLSGDIVSPGQRGRAIGLLHTAGDLCPAAMDWLAWPLSYLRRAVRRGPDPRPVGSAMRSAGHLGCGIGHAAPSTRFAGYIDTTPLVDLNVPAYVAQRQGTGYLVGNGSDHLGEETLIWPLTASGSCGACPPLPALRRGERPGVHDSNGRPGASTASQVLCPRGHRAPCP